jgi:hypothetical protein
VRTAILNDVKAAGYFSLSVDSTPDYTQCNHKIRVFKRL